MSSTVAPDDKLTEAEFHAAEAEIASKMNRRLYSLLHNKDKPWEITLARVHKVAEASESSVRYVTANTKLVLHSTGDAVLAHNQSRPWSYIDRKRTLEVLSNGSGGIDGLMDQIKTLRRAVDDLEDILGETKSIMHEMKDAYTELEKRRARDTGK